MGQGIYDMSVARGRQGAPPRIFFVRVSEASDPWPSTAASFYPGHQDFGGKIFGAQTKLPVEPVSGP